VHRFAGLRAQQRQPRPHRVGAGGRRLAAARRELVGPGGRRPCIALLDGGVQCPLRVVQVGAPDRAWQRSLTALRRSLNGRAFDFPQHKSFIG